MCVDLFFACCSLSSRDPREFRVTTQNLNTPHRMKERKKERKETTVPSLCRRLLVSPSLFLSLLPSHSHSLTQFSVSQQTVEATAGRIYPCSLSLSLSLRLSSFCLPVCTSVWTLVSPSRPLHSVDTNLIRLSLLLCRVQSSRLFPIYDDSCFNQQMCLFSSCCPLFLVDLPKLVYQVRK